MKLKILFFLCLMLVVNVVMAVEPTTAEENDPTTNNEANACFIGGSWEGQCNSVDLNRDGSVDDWEIEYMWIAGWYFIRFERGLISREAFPPQYFWALPPEIVLPEVVGGIITPPSLMCLDSTIENDVAYTGVSNNTSNLPRFSSTDGSCSGSALGPDTTFYIIEAGSLIEADNLCPLLGIYDMPIFGFNSAPANFYVCTNITT